MAEWDSQYRKWAELMDQKSIDAPLSEEELLFCERFAKEHPASERELALLAELAVLDVAPNAESRVLVDATLARLAAEAASAELDEVTQLKRGGRFPRFVWLSAAAAVLALGSAVLLVPHKKAGESIVAAPVGPAPRVELVYAAGEVQVDGKLVSGSSMLLAEGSVLEVGHGAACLAMDPDINVCASAETKLRLSRTQSAWRRLDLEAGEVALQLAPQPEGWRLSIVADGVWSTAVGTAFTVQRDSELGVRTTVLNGKVRVGSDGGKEQIVAAHERAHVKRDQTEIHAISRSDESPEWALLRPAKLWMNPVSATLEVHGLPKGAEVALDDQVIGAAPLSSLVPAGAHRLDVLVAGRVAATRELVLEVGQLTSLSFEGQVLDSQAAPEVSVPEPQPVTRAPGTGRRSAQKSLPEPAAMPEAPAVPAAFELLSQARRLMHAEHFAEAAAQYQALRQTYPESPEARAVLVSLAEVQLDKLGQPHEALDNLEHYLSGGNGALIEEARRVRIRALQMLGEHQREKIAIAEFLRAHPKSFQAAALLQRLTELSAQP
jgi:hypothetical protein